MHDSFEVFANGETKPRASSLSYSDTTSFSPGLSRIDACLKIFFLFVSIPKLIAVVFFSIFDTKCIIFEEASVMNCSQNFFVPNPTHWVLVWLVMSMISSVVFLVIVYLNQTELNYQIGKAKRICRKGSFHSFMFLLLASSVYYFIRIFTKSGAIDLSTSVILFLWSPVTALLSCCFNYLPRVHWKKVGPTCFSFDWWTDCLAKNSNFIIYWLALILCFVEVTCKATSILLDVTYEVAPLIQMKFQEESGQFEGVMVIVIGLRLAFHVRLLSFFWGKMFHGEDDLITEPNARLVEETQRSSAEMKNIR